MLVMPECEAKRRTSSPIVTLLGTTARRALRTKENNFCEENGNQPHHAEISMPEKTVGVPLFKGLKSIDDSSAELALLGHRLRTKVIKVYHS